MSNRASDVIGITIKETTKHFVIRERVDHFWFFKGPPRKWPAEGMRLVVFDQHARRLSGWHYEKLRAVGGEWIQRSVVLCAEDEVGRLVEMLVRFGVRDIRVFAAEEVEIGGAWEDYDKS